MKGRFESLTKPYANNFLMFSIETQQIRYLLDNSQKIVPPHLEQLNWAKVREDEDFNILSTLTKYDRDKKLIIEMPIGLNYIKCIQLTDLLQKQR